MRTICLTDSATFITLMPPAIVSITHPILLIFRLFTGSSFHLFAFSFSAPPFDSPLLTATLQLSFAYLQSVRAHQYSISTIPEKPKNRCTYSDHHKPTAFWKTFELLISTWTMVTIPAAQLSTADCMIDHAVQTGSLSSVRSGSLPIAQPLSIELDERDVIQKKTFTKWVNKHLIKVRRWSALFLEFSLNERLISVRVHWASLGTYRVSIFAWNIVRIRLVRIS